MNFERFIPNTPKQPMVKVTITTVDTNLEYERTLTPSDADTFVNKLTHEKRVSWVDRDQETTYHVNTRNII